jgi:hypothetical protein
VDWKDPDEVRRQIRELPKRMDADDNFVNAVLNGDSQVAQIQFNDAIQDVVATMGEEKLEFMQQYFANAEFRNFVNERVFSACLKDIAERGKSRRQAPTAGWSHLQDEDESGGGFLAAAEPEADGSNGQ